jgi:hypothetical protein
MTTQKAPDDPYYVPPGPLTVETVTYHGPELDFVLVHAYEMTDTVFKYKCPCKKGYHVHGNGGDPFTNRREFRSTHCQRSPESVDLEILIDDRTTRKLKKQKSTSK